MTQYKTYQEAKIANPESEIFTKKFEGIFKSIKKPETNHFIDGWKICKPEDYCMTLESFLASGKRLVCGDLFIGCRGKVSTVACEAVMNVPESTDRDTYILKAKALENPAHEWDGCGFPPAGVECECFCFDESKWLKVKVLDAITGSKEVAVAVICHGNRYRKVFWGVKFRPIETQQQREERKRLESAYHLACIAGAVDKWGGEFTFDEFKKDEFAVKRWLAVVDETKYLRGDK